MKLKYVIPGIAAVCVVVIGVFAMMAPKQSLQIPPIEAKAQAYLDQHGFLEKNEKLTGYKAISYLNYDEAAVITDHRIFLYQDSKVHSIPLSKITLVVVKNTELGHQEVIVSAQSLGAIGFELNHSYVPALIKMLKVSDAIVKHEGKDSVETTKHEKTKADKAA